MSSVIAAGCFAKLLQNRSTIIAVIRAVPVLLGMFSNRLMVGCEHKGAPLSGNRPAASLNSGSSRSASQSSASSWPQAMAIMRNSSISSTAWLIRLGSRRSSTQDASMRVSPRRRSASRRSNRPPSEEMAPPSKLAETFLRQMAGRSKRRKLSSLMADVARVGVAAGNRLDNEFLHQINKLRYIRQPRIIALMNNSG